MTYPGGIDLGFTLPASVSGNFPDAGSKITAIAAATSFKGWFRSDPSEVAMSGGGANIISDAGGSAATLFASGTDTPRATFLADALPVPGLAERFPIFRVGDTPCPYRYSGTFNANLAFTWVTMWRANAFPTGAETYSVIGAVENAGGRVWLEMLGSIAGTLRFRGNAGSTVISAPMTTGALNMTICSFAPGTPNTLRLKNNGVRATDVTFVGDPNHGTAVPVMSGYSYTGSSGAKNLDWSECIMFQEDLFTNPALLARVETYFRDLYEIG